MNKIKIAAVIFAAFISAVTITSCGKKGEETKGNAAEESTEEGAAGEGSSFLELKDEQIKAAGIESDSIQERSVSAILKVNGVLDVPPQSLYSINAPYGGFLKNTELLEGTRVKKGEVIATLEHPDYIQMQQDYMNSVSQLAFLEKDYQRQVTLQKENASAAKTLQKAESEYNSLLATVKGLEAKFTMIGIDKDAVKEGKITSVILLRSPINGYVSKVNANIGKYVSSEDIIFEIVNTDKLQIELTVFEKDIDKIKVGQKIRFTLANDPGKKHTARVYLIGRLLDESRTVRIHGHLDKEDPHLLPGMYINATIDLGEKVEATVPRQSVVMDNGKKYVFVQNTICAEHPECSAHESCPKEENCKEHPDCEDHEKLSIAQVDAKHKRCEAHESCKNKSLETKIKEQQEAGYYTFSKMEIETGTANEIFVAINFKEPTDAHKKIVTKGAFFLLSQSKTGGMDACAQ